MFNAIKSSKREAKKTNNSYLLKIKSIPQLKWQFGKAIRDMHQRHHGNEKEEWIRNQLKRIYGKNNSHKS